MSSGPIPRTENGRYVPEYHDIRYGDSSYTECVVFMMKL